MVKLCAKEKYDKMAIRKEKICSFAVKIRIYKDGI